MKKTYEKPFAEKVEFDYKSQMVVASSTSYTNYGINTCTSPIPTLTTGTSGCYA